LTFPVGRLYRSLDAAEPPEAVAAAFDRGDPEAGVAVIALALHHQDPYGTLPLVARALASTDPGLRHQGIVALAHVARLHRTTDRRCLALLRAFHRGNEADDDLWTYVPRRRLPWWLWRHHLGRWALWWLRDRRRT
jgi:hypothetical protein